MADINNYLDGLDYNLSDDEKFLMDIFAECWEYCRESDCTDCKYRSGNKYCKMLLCMSYQYAQRLIVADVQPVVHAYWINTRCGTWKCSNCKGIYDTDSCYCPNCGARMDGDS